MTRKRWSRHRGVARLEMDILGVSLAAGRLRPNLERADLSRLPRNRDGGPPEHPPKMSGGARPRDVLEVPE